MVEKKQFTLKWLLVELTLGAVFLGLLSWNLPLPPAKTNVVHTVLWICMGAPVVFAVTGAMFGGLFGRFLKGAVIGASVYVVFIALVVAVIVLFALR
jgi:hypothetical protein